MEPERGKYGVGTIFRVLFMTCTVSNNGDTCEFFAATLEMQHCSFRRSSKIFVDCILPYLHKIFVEIKILCYTIAQLEERNITLARYSEAIYNSCVLL